MRRRASSLVFCRLSHQTHQTDERVGERVAERRKDVSNQKGLALFFFAERMKALEVKVTITKNLICIFESETSPVGAALRIQNL